jgi:hypothetical protein
MLERLIAVDLVDSVQCEIEVSALVLAVGAACKGAPIPNNTMLSTKSTGLRRCTRCRQKCMCFLFVSVWFHVAMKKWAAYCAVSSEGYCEQKNTPPQGRGKKLS